MISFAVRMKFATEDRAEVAESLRLLAAASRQEPGCINYIPHYLEDEGPGGAPRVRALQKPCGRRALPEDAGAEYREPGGPGLRFRPSPSGESEVCVLICREFIEL